MGFVTALYQEGLRQPKCLHAFVQKHRETFQRTAPKIVKHDPRGGMPLEVTNAEDKSL